MAGRGGAKKGNYVCVQSLDPNELDDETLVYFDAFSDAGRGSLSDTSMGSALKRRRWLLDYNEDGEQEKGSSDIKPKKTCLSRCLCCTVRFRTLIIVFLISFIFVLLVLLLAPSSIQVNQAVEQLRNMHSQVKSTRAELFLNATLDLSAALGTVTAGTLARVLLTDTLLQPQHAANSLIGSLGYVDIVTFQDPDFKNFLPGLYALDIDWSNFNASLMYENFSLETRRWQNSAAPLLLSTVSTGFMQKVSRAFVLFDDQEIAVSIEPGIEPNTWNYYFWIVFSNPEDGRSKHFGVRYKANAPRDESGPEMWTVDSQSKSPVSALPVEYFFGVLEHQRTFKNDTKPKGYWTPVIIQGGVERNETRWSWSFPLFNFPSCVDYGTDPSCVRAVVGGVITVSELNEVCSDVLQTAAGALPAVQTFIRQDILRVNLSDGAEYYIAKENLQPPLSELFAGLKDAAELQLVTSFAMTFLVTFGSTNSDPDGVFIAGSSSREVLRNEPFQFATNSSDVQVAVLSRFLEQYYGPINVNSTIFSEADNANPPTVLVDVRGVNIGNPADPGVVTLCDVSSKGVNPELCVLLTVNRVSSKSVHGFPSGNSIGFLSVLAIPNFFLVGRKITEGSASLDQVNDRIEEEFQRIKLVELVEAIISAVILIAALALSFYLARAVAQPLERLQQAVLRLKEMDFREGPEREQSGVVEVQELADGITALQGTLRVVKRFIPSSVVGQIIRNEENAREMQVEEREVTIFFSDLAGFTSLSECLVPSEMLNFLTRYLTLMTKGIEVYGGTVAEIEGDGILAYWNTPDFCVDHALKACASAIAQQASLRQLNLEFAPLMQKYGLEPLQMRVGIHTGVVLTGNIGSLYKRKFGCLGDAVNLASRLEGICKLYGCNIICSADTRAHLPATGVIVRELDTVRVKGKKDPTNLFEVVALTKSFTYRRDAYLRSCEDISKLDVVVVSVLSPSKKPSQQVLENLQLYEKALEEYRAAQFMRAKETLSQISQDKPGAFLAQRVEKACQEYDEDSVEPFDAILNLMEKSF